MTKSTQMTFNPTPRSVLACYRFSAGMSQARLASLSGVRKETISRVETGKVQPRARTQAAIAAVFGLPADVLFPEVGDD